jgi:LPS export ABC transporter protein LptC
LELNIKKRTTTKSSSLLIFFLLLSSCSFDYGEAVVENENQPDIIMGEVEYVRVRNGDPVVRFRAQQAERYEKRQTMELQNFSFEQFDGHGDEINATGRAGSASVELDSGNIRLARSIIISVDSEDITIETDKLSWEDNNKILSGSEADRVDIQRSDGTIFSGKGFTAHARNRTWEFSGEVTGTYIDKDEEEADSSAEVPLEKTAAEVSANTPGSPGALSPDPENTRVPSREGADDDKPMESALWS